MGTGKRLEARVLDTNRPQVYEILVKGELDAKWADWFEGFALSFPGKGLTLLSGDAVDQAALHGALARIHGLGLKVLLVLCTDVEAAEFLTNYIYS